jgi:DNA-directed RNA polymerase specialized sigma24 family protein
VDVTAATPITVADHLEWARGIAAGVARGQRFTGREADDLIQEACRTLAEKARGFRRELVPAGGDPAGAFRGWAHRAIQSECRRLGAQLRNGGTYRTRRKTSKTKAVAVVQWSALATDDGTAFDPAGSVSTRATAHDADPGEFWEAVRGIVSEAEGDALELAYRGNFEIGQVAWLLRVSEAGAVRLLECAVERLGTVARGIAALEPWLRRLR